MPTRPSPPSELAVAETLRDWPLATVVTLGGLVTSWLVSWALVSWASNGLGATVRNGPPGGFQWLAAHGVWGTLRLVRRDLGAGVGDVRFVPWGAALLGSVGYLALSASLARSRLPPPRRRWFPFRVGLLSMLVFFAYALATGLASGVDVEVSRPFTLTATAGLSLVPPLFVFGAVSTGATWLGLSSRPRTAEGRVVAGLGILAVGMAAAALVAAPLVSGRGASAAATTTAFAPNLSAVVIAYGTAGTVEAEAAGSLSVGARTASMDRRVPRRAWQRPWPYLLTLLVLPALVAIGWWAAAGGEAPVRPVGAGLTAGIAALVVLVVSGGRFSLQGAGRLGVSGLLAAEVSVPLVLPAIVSFVAVSIGALVGWKRPRRRKQRRNTRSARGI